MSRYNHLNITHGKAICYSGYRKGQSPETGIHPTKDQVREDLHIIDKFMDYIRVYDCSPHAETILEVISEENLHLKVLQGVYIEAEMNNFGCPWGKIYSEEELVYNQSLNIEKVIKLIELANAYPEIIFALSAGNEATVDWTDHYVPVQKVITYVEMLKKGTNQPVTFCENYVPWHNKLEPLAEAVDFISIHSYPVWEYKHISEALEYTKQNFLGIADKYPHKPIMITEAGWATNTNGKGIDPGNVSEEFQEQYYHDLQKWCDKEKIITFVFEAFDEPWKGSPEANEPEKHWGLFYEDRSPKKVMKPQFKNR